MKVRRIVTGRDSSGKSMFVSDGAAPRTIEFKHIPGLAASFLWETVADSSIDTKKDASLSARSWVPAPGATNLMLITFPPDRVMMEPGFDPAAAGNEYMQFLPGIAESFEIDNPGMHSTESVDYCLLIEGELHLELDDGVSTKLLPGDVAIQGGTRHAWRNKSDKPATILFVLVGAKRI